MSARSRDDKEKKDDNQSGYMHYSLSTTARIPTRLYVRYSIRQSPSNEVCLYGKKIDSMFGMSAKHTQDLKFNP